MSLGPEVEQALLYGVSVVILLGGLVVVIWQYLRFRRGGRDED